MSYRKYTLQSEFYSYTRRHTYSLSASKTIVVQHTVFYTPLWCLVVVYRRTHQFISSASLWATAWKTIADRGSLCSITRCVYLSTVIYGRCEFGIQGRSHNKPVDILQTTIPNSFFLNEICIFWLKFHRTLFPLDMDNNSPSRVTALRKTDDKYLTEPYEKYEPIWCHQATMSKFPLCWIVIFTT